MNAWRLDNQPVYGIGPLEEYLAALHFGATCEGHQQRLVVAVGDAGTGKTIGARIFCMEHKSHPVYVRIPPKGFITARALLHLIGEPIGLTTDLRTRYDVARRLADESLRRPRVFVLDEAQGMCGGDALEIIRWLHDEGGHTFILVGAPALDQPFRDHRQFASRVALRHQLRLPTVEEIAPIFDDFPPEAIQQVYEETGGRMREIMTLRRRLDDLIEQGKLDPADLAAKKVRMVARHFLVRAA
jgi:DNA transposition AAA+ family ATPase